MAQNKSVQLGFRVSAKKANLLEELSKSTDRPRSWLLEQALDRYLDTQAWQIAAIQEGIADADAGRIIPHERVRDWLKSWGTEDETGPPT